MHDAEVAKILRRDDKVYLPVDSVIIYIFQKIGLHPANFLSVNKVLRALYTAEQMLVWDDLWYWGFFTQVSDGINRQCGWNQDKFWCQVTAPKAQEVQVRRLGEEFLRIITDELPGS